MASRAAVDCRVAPGNDNGGSSAGHRLAGMEV
jgi:hypothetical protein